MRSTRVTLPAGAARFVALAAAVLVCSGAVTAAALDLSLGRGIKGSGKLETREIAVDPFDQLEVSGAFDVVVSVGGEQKVTVTFDDNLLDLLELRVDDGELELGWRKSCRPSRGSKVAITVPDLREVEVSGAGDLDVTGLKGIRFEAEVSGAGDLTLAGSVEVFELELSGAGDVDAKKLEAQVVSAEISGAGSADVHASRRIEAEVSGAGDLTYRGDPQERDIDVSGAGSVRKR